MRNQFKITLLTFFCATAMLFAQEKINLENTGLTHTVYFKLKPDADKQTLINSLATFKDIPVVKNLQIGTRVETSDHTNSLSDYSVFVTSTFKNLEDFRIYVEHPIHVASIKATKNLMAAPPISYDHNVVYKHNK